MPKQTAKSGLAAKLGAKGAEAFEKHKRDEAKVPGGGSLPAGIENGIAKLKKCYFDKYKKGDYEGEYYFLASGTVVAPTVHNGIPIEGLSTMVMEPCCETKNRDGKITTIEEHIQRITNHMKLLGAETDEITFDQLEDVAAALEAEGTHFRFRTWQGEPNEKYPNPRVNEQWRGRCDIDVAVDEDVVDNTSEGGNDAPEENAVDYEALLKAAKSKNAKTAEEAQTRISDLAEAAGLADEVNAAEDWDAAIAILQGAGDGAGSDDGAEAAAGAEGDEDLDALAVAADEGDEEANARLVELAEAAGINLDEHPEPWVEFVEHLKGGGEEAEGDSEEWNVNEVATYTVSSIVVNPKTKKKTTVNKDVECEITAINAKAGTCTLKNLEDGKTLYKDVPLSDLTR